MCACRSVAYLLESVVDPSDAVILRGQEKTARQLRLTRSRVEDGGRCMDEPFLRHQVVRLKRRLQTREAFLQTSQKTKEKKNITGIK